jgi:hypothetical protein
MARHGAVIPLALLLCSCATTSLPYRELSAKDERLGDSALLCLRVVMETSDGRFASTPSGRVASAQPLLHFLLEDGEGYRDLDVPLWMDEKDWERTGERYRFTRDVLAKVPTGTYLLKALQVYLGETFTSSSRISHYHLWFPRIGFIIPEPRAYAMGVLHLDIDSIEGDWPRDPDITSRLQLDRDADAFAVNAAALAGRTPLLGADPAPLAVRYSYSLIAPQDSDNDFDWRKDAFWPDTSTERLVSGFQGEQYFLRKNLTDDMFSFIRPVSVQRLSQNYDIEWNARLLNGEPGKRFGLMLGTDERSCLVFTASGDGAVAVYPLVDGTWQKSLLGPSPTAAWTMQSGEINRFLVSVRGSQVRFAVNGASLGGFTSPFDLSLAFIAPFLESQGVLSISRFRIAETP